MEQDSGQRITFQGTGPGARTADGSSVELYLLLKPHGEPELIRGVLAKGSSVLELGCGVGRVTNPLVQFGYDVVGVDNSEEMLALVPSAKTVKSDIETLNLSRTFDAVLLMSHLINIPSVPVRRAFLATCRHVADNGIVIIQRHNPKWLDAVHVGCLGSKDGIDAFVDSVRREGSTVGMTLRWRVGEKAWTQTSTAQRLDDEDIEKSLNEVDLQIERWLDERQTRLVARPQ
jgi:SAM-dependent methyltransferase